jgi:hypothetical protein
MTTSPELRGTRCYVAWGAAPTGPLNCLCPAFVFATLTAKKPRFGRNPTFSALTRAAWLAAVKRLRAFRLAYRVAYQAWRSGDRSVEFLMGTWWVVRHAGASAPT